MAKKIYISGKMGEKTLSKATKEKFAQAEERMKNDGWSVFNPAGADFQEALNEHLAYLRSRRNLRNEAGEVLVWDMGAIARCDAIYMLKDWRDSPGATAEYYFAKAIGIKILYEDESNS